VQPRQAPAQIWQCCAPCGEHSRAQASQTSAHKVHSAVENSPLRASIAAHSRQTAAQSVQRPMQRFMRAGSSSRHMAAHTSQATAHS
jgi:hypothetical protein